MRSRGFTLIELLVVIAIIGILSSVVLASLNVARGKGSDSAVKANLANIRAQAEIQYDNTGDYGTAYGPGECTGAGVGTLFANSVIANQIAGAKTAAGGGLSSCYSFGSPTALKWAVTVQLKSDPAQAHCSDSSGASKVMNNSGAYDQAALDVDLTGAACGN